MSRLYDEDGIDGPFESAMDAAIRDDAAARKPVALGSVPPSNRVRFANGEVGKVIKHDGDDFDTWTLVYCPERRKRSRADSRRYMFRRGELVTVVRDRVVGCR
jgi:hypothetical protein